MFFGPIGKTRWSPWPLINWDIFDWSPETAEWNSTKLGLRGIKISTSSTKFVFFLVDRKNKMAALASDWMIHFRLLPWNRWKESNETCQVTRSQRPLPSLSFSGRSDIQDCRPGLSLADTFSTSALKGIQQTWQEARSRRPLTNLCFSVRSEKQDAPLASDWLRHFRFLLWNRWTEFNETWQEARSQRPLPDLCFWTDRKNKMAALASDWPRHFDFSPERISTKIGLRGSKISTSSTNFVFFGRIRKTKWPPWPLNC